MDADRVALAQFRGKNCRNMDWSVAAVYQAAECAMSVNAPALQNLQIILPLRS